MVLIFILGVDIKRPALDEVVEVRDAANFHEWAEHMASKNKKIGSLDLLMICIPDRNHDDDYSGIKVLTELNYGK